jgi:hypothetical protein
MNRKSSKTDAKEGFIRPAHTLGAEAGTIAGEVAGALVGSIAGPPGAIAGMVVGAAVGALAGEVMDEEAERTSRHDHELDDAIGVTRGDLGARRTPLPPPK